MSSSLLSLNLSFQPSFPETQELLKDDLQEFPSSPWDDLVDYFQRFPADHLFSESHPSSNPQYQSPSFSSTQPHSPNLSFPTLPHPSCSEPQDITFSRQNSNTPYTDSYESSSQTEESSDYSESPLADGISKKSKKIKKRDMFSRKYTRQAFSFKEDLLLTKYFVKYGNDWKKIASCMKKRTLSKVRNRYYTFHRNEETFQALLFVLHDFEKEDQIEKIPEDLLTPFQRFIPNPPKPSPKRK